jgi:hypothetical protein
MNYSVELILVHAPEVISDVKQSTELSDSPNGLAGNYPDAPKFSAAAAPAWKSRA